MVLQERIELYTLANFNFKFNTLRRYTKVFLYHYSVMNYVQISCLVTSLLEAAPSLRP